MQNVKVHVDDALYPACRDRLVHSLGAIREMRGRDLVVDVAACQFAVIPVCIMPDLPLVNVEMQIIPKAKRIRKAILSVSANLRRMVQAAADIQVGVRVMALDPETYIALQQNRALT